MFSCGYRFLKYETFSSFVDVHIGIDDFGFLLFNKCISSQIQIHILTVIILVLLDLFK